MKENNNRAILTEGPIKKTLFWLTVPMVYGITGMVLFNLIDTYFVGKLGADELAALSFTFPVVFVINGIIFGIGTGVSAVVSNAIGQNDEYKVKRYTTDALSLGLALVIVFCVAGYFTIEPLFRQMGAEEKLLPLIKEYMEIWYLGAVFVVIPMIGNNAIRATGDTKTPSNLMLAAVAVNLILDPIFIFGFWFVPSFGVAGAAIAAVVSRGVTFFIAIRVLYFRDKMISLKIPSLKEGIESWKKILYIGLPSGATNIIIPLGLGLITKIISTYGSEAVAALGVEQRIEAFALTILMALGSALGPFIGQNLGAKKFDRIEKALSYSMKFGVYYGIGVTLILAVFAENIASLFNDNPDIINIITNALRIVPISYFLMGVLMVANVSINVLNRPLIASTISLFRIFAILIPLTYTGSYLFGLNGIFGAIAITNFIAGLAAYYILKSVIKSEKAKAELNNSIISS